MMRALWSAASGMLAQQLNLDTISNNLANVNTTGFKASRAQFQDLLYQTVKPAGVPLTRGNETPIGIQVGAGTKPVAIQKLFTQGSFQQTDNPLDLDIQGDGFFQVQMPDGSTAYTRDGSFNMDADGRIVTADGNFLQPEVVAPANTQSVSVTSDGKIYAQLPNETQPTLIGQIETAKFINPAGLNSLGQNLYSATAASGDAQIGTPSAEGFGSIGEGFLESSNVQVVTEMVNMITTQRAYEANSKAIQAADQMLSLANNLRQG